MAMPSDVENPTGSDDSPPLTESMIEWQDVRVGVTLGKGTFCKVKNVSLFSSKGKDSVRHKSKYAAKYLRNSTVKKNVFAAAAAEDLRMEGQLLASLKHENIIKLHAQGRLSMNNKDSGRHYLLLERLDETLDHRLRVWRFPDDFVKKPPPLERLRLVAIPVAKALEYLHSKNIVFRDLNPYNIGFKDGTVKLFDFGLARRVSVDRRLTGRVGSPFYMAPEVWLSKDYGLPVDVYAFSLILWEVMTMAVPLIDIKPSDLEKAVVRENRRPMFDERCGTAQLQELICKAWARTPSTRPTFSTVCSVLEDEVKTVDGFMQTTEQTTAIQRFQQVCHPKI